MEAGETFSGVLPLSRQPDNLLGSFMHGLEEFGDQTLLVAQAVRVAKGEKRLSFASLLLLTHKQHLRFRRVVTNLR